jgi:hypothetical protein
VSVIKNLGSSADFGVVGAYPDGREWDLLTAKPGERPKADQTIAALPAPDKNPVYGIDAQILIFWTWPALRVLISRNVWDMRASAGSKASSA